MIPAANTACGKPTMINLPLDTSIADITVPAIPSLQNFTYGADIFRIKVTYKCKEWHLLRTYHRAWVSERCYGHEE
jgi:hypothetical protein